MPAKDFGRIMLSSAPASKASQSAQGLSINPETSLSSFFWATWFSRSADGLNIISQLFLIFNSRRDQLRTCDGARTAAFQGNDGSIGMYIDLIPGIDFLLGQNAMLD